jgi:FkbM family methyltransferase
MLVERFRRYLLKQRIAHIGDQFIRTKYLGHDFLLFENDRISQQIINGHGWENHITQLIDIFCKPGMIVIDCGANFGLFTLQLAKAVGAQGKVYAFETQNLISQQLNLNVITNGFRNVELFRNAAWRKSSERLFMEEMDTSQAIVNIGAAKLVDASQNPILSLALDDLQLSNCDFIKLDVQGSEVDCLLGADKIISKLRPILVVEIENAHLQTLGRSDEELINLLLAKNYKIGRILNNYPADHICIPAEKVDVLVSDIDKLPFAISWIEGSRIRINGGHNLYSSYEVIDVTNE